MGVCRPLRFSIVAHVCIGAVHSLRACPATLTRLFLSDADHLAMVSPATRASALPSLSSAVSEAATGHKHATEASGLRVCPIAACGAVVCLLHFASTIAPATVRRAHMCGDESDRAGLLPGLPMRSTYLFDSQAVLLSSTPVADAGCVRERALHPGKGTDGRSGPAPPVFFCSFPRAPVVVALLLSL